jgi:mannonate dehydratase
MAFEQTWRWFGPNDPISLKEIKQTGAAGVVTALHQIPVGNVWPVEEILQRKEIIEAEGLEWTVVESVPVHENIKKQKENYLELIENYKQTLLNLGKCGVNTVCYNFMPVLDWSRTDLQVTYKDGSITTKFEAAVFAAFDLFILKRNGAAKSYTEEQITAAKELFDNMDDERKEKLKETVLLGLPGSLEAYTLEEFRSALAEYNLIDADKLRENLIFFIRQILPAAEASGVFLAIHPDDPPFSLLGLPRVVGSKEDIRKILEAADSPYNGFTLCAGSLGAGFNNDLVDIAKTFANKVNFVHLRNLVRNAQGDFLEENHLEGDINIYGIMKALIIEQKRRSAMNCVNNKMPLRPDHGHLMIPDMNRKGIYPGYSLFGRMRGLAELRGLEMGIRLSLGL